MVVLAFKSAHCFSTRMEPGYLAVLSSGTVYSTCISLCKVALTFKSVDERCPDMYLLVMCDHS